MEGEQKESVEVGSRARRRGSISHLPGGGCLRWELSLANYTALNSSALPSPPSVSPGRCKSAETPEDSKYSSGLFYFIYFLRLPALQVGSTFTLAQDVPSLTCRFMFRSPAGVRGAAEG